MFLNISSAFISQCILKILLFIMSHSINIVHWNCQGFNAHGPEYIWSLSKQKHVPDIICLQETLFQNENDQPSATGVCSWQPFEPTTMWRDGTTDSTPEDLLLVISWSQNCILKLSSSHCSWNLSRRGNCYVINAGKPDKCKERSSHCGTSTVTTC